MHRILDNGEGHCKGVDFTLTSIIQGALKNMVIMSVRNTNFWIKYRKAIRIITNTKRVNSHTEDRRKEYILETRKIRFRVPKG